MSATNPFLVFTDRLNQLGVRYMVTGSVASMAYGEPRLTHDVDIVIEISREHCERFGELFPGEEFYCPPVEVLLIESARPQRGHFNLIHHDTGLKADIYPCGRDRLSAWGLDHARKLVVDHSEVWIAPPEYVIARKLEYYAEGGSEKHLRDIEGILAVSRAAIDSDTLERNIDLVGGRAAWAKVRSPPE
jgi:hypothetical protein